jgi:hypothetical protein
MNPFPTSSWTAHFLVIAAPRPFGLADLVFIQASITEGRFLWMWGSRMSTEGSIGSG